jgi:hypothetical protein
VTECMVCVCVCVCVRALACAHAYVLACTCAHARMCLCVCVCALIHLFYQMLTHALWHMHNFTFLSHISFQIYIDNSSGSL